MGSLQIEAILFYVLALIAVGGALAVVLSQHVVRMAAGLVVCLGAVAGLFMLLHADFLGAAQLMIYVGGTIVILIFGVMLTSGASVGRVNASPGEMLAALGLGGLFFALMVFTVGSVDWEAVAARQPISPRDADLALDRLQASTTSSDDQAQAKRDRAETLAQRSAGRSTRPLGISLLGMRHETDDLAGGKVTSGTGYLLPFEIISMHLLVVLIGAAYLARAKQKVKPNEQLSMSGGHSHGS